MNFSQINYKYPTLKVPFSSARFPIQTLRKKSWQAGWEINCLLSDLMASFKQFASPNCSWRRISNKLVFFSSASKHSFRTPIARSPNSLKLRNIADFLFRKALYTVYFFKMMHAWWVSQLVDIIFSYVKY